MGETIDGAIGPTTVRVGLGERVSRTWWRHICGLIGFTGAALAHTASKTRGQTSTSREISRLLDTSHELSRPDGYGQRPWVELAQPAGPTSSTARRRHITFFSPTFWVPDCMAPRQKGLQV